VSKGAPATLRRFLRRAVVHPRRASPSPADLRLRGEGVGVEAARAAAEGREETAYLLLAGHCFGVLSEEGPVM
jgi:hypothetical protein